MGVKRGGREGCGYSRLARDFPGGGEFKADSRFLAEVSKPMNVIASKFQYLPSLALILHTYLSGFDDASAARSFCAQILEC